jgi:hypothetical protein
MLKALIMWDDLSRTKSHHKNHAQYLGDYSRNTMLSLRSANAIRLCC